MTLKIEYSMEENNSLFTRNALKWYHYPIHLGYYIPYWIKFFFSKPFKEEKKDLNILDIVQTLLDSEPTSTDNIQKSKELTKLHRVVENTKARRRLEKWSLRVIATYLLVVLLIVIACYIKLPINDKEVYHIIEIPSEIMITILSTTTVNIIGLGLIVLRGHFLANDKANNMEDENTTR